MFSPVKVLLVGAQGALRDRVENALCSSHSSVQVHTDHAVHHDMFEPDVVLLLHADMDYAAHQQQADEAAQRWPEIPRINLTLQPRFNDDTAEPTFTCCFSATPAQLAPMLAGVPHEPNENQDGHNDTSLHSTAQCLYKFMRQWNRRLSHQL